MVVRRIKVWRRRGGLKLAVFSYRKPNPYPLIPSYQSLVTSPQLLFYFESSFLYRAIVSSYGAFSTPFSVMIPAMREDGVTSKAGL